MKIAKFSHPCILSPAEGVPLELGIGAWGQKTRLTGLPGRERSLTTTSAMWIQCTDVTDRQMDRWTDTGPQQRPRLRIASRGKNRDHVLHASFLVPITLVNHRMSTRVHMVMFDI